MTEKKLNICKECGEKLGTMADCDICDGTGEIMDDEGGVEEFGTCWKCKGIGMVYYSWLCPNPYCKEIDEEI
jgi:hypothetical protein